ncbi:hypothetical protein CDD81_6219 [Ophiocordyceps australis]|uniref:Uncharacterized protein n=1 Tax=Ophiocordyceps australis TaxID=1399860 RepID=A0A2C5XHU6_9HYPO|nr:hypothetical protein CDD81_6219 [Ophiocordyceps australis]
MNFKCLVLVALVGFSAAIQGENVNPIDLVKSNMHQDVDGYIHLGMDGVVRSVSHDKKILDYLPLSPEQISAFIDNYPAHTPEQKDTLKAAFANVDGRVVSEDVMRNPPAHPEPATVEGQLAAPLSRWTLQCVYCIE